MNSNGEKPLSERAQETLHLAGEKIQEGWDKSLKAVGLREETPAEKMQRQAEEVKKDMQAGRNEAQRAAQDAGERARARLDDLGGKSYLEQAKDGVAYAAEFVKETVDSGLTAVGLKEETTGEHMARQGREANENFKEAAEAGADTAAIYGQKAKEKVREAGENAKEAAEEYAEKVKEKVTEATAQATEKAKEYGRIAKDKMEETGESAADKLKEFSEATKERAEDARTRAASQAAL